MLKFTDYDIVFQEIPTEVTLAINLSLCPNNCIGCHSPQLREDIGDILNKESLDLLINKYGTAITCISLMGGDGDTETIAILAQYIKQRGYRSAWYSGRQDLPPNFRIECFDYVKLGPYIEALGGLDNPNTNQRLYRIIGQHITDITHLMTKSNK